MEKEDKGSKKEMCEITAFCLTCGDHKKVASISIEPTEGIFVYILECDHTISVKGLKYGISYVHSSPKLEGKRKLPFKWQREMYKEISFGD